MAKIKNIQRLSILLILTSVFFMPLSQAAFNPYKKDVNLHFDESIPWKFSNNQAVKSGQNKDRGEINYYHLKINHKRILLRLGRSDPSGNAENTRPLDALDIIDVMIDGQRLPLFQWCMDNRSTQAENKVFRPGTVVKNDICSNSGGGDFVIKLDGTSRRLLSQGKALQFMTRPYKAQENISYDLSDLPPLLERMARAENPRPVAKKVVEKKAVRKPKPVAKPKVKKTAKLCQAKPPLEYKAKISAVSYPCNNALRKTTAEKRIHDHVQIEKQKQAAETEHRRAASARKQAESEMKQQSKKWETMQDSMWVVRCKKHWDSGISPCYCRRVLSQAPAGTVDTCNK